MPIQMIRGLKADLPSLADGEIGLVTDTGAEEVWIGTPGTGNVQIPVLGTGTQVLDATGSPPPLPITSGKIFVFYSGSDDPSSANLPSAGPLAPNHSIEIHKEFSGGTGTLSIAPFGAETINGVAAPFVIPASGLITRFLRLSPTDWHAF